MGIVCVYVYQATLFVACLALDERRKRAGRHALVPCMKTRQEATTEDNKGNGDDDAESGSVDNQVRIHLGIL